MELKPYTLQTELTNYIPLPRSILPMELSSTAALIYGILLDRATLSRKSGWEDQGWVYAVYPIRELSHALHLGDTTVKTNLSILENKGLIRKVRRRRKEANRIFLRIPSDAVMDAGTAGKRTGEGPKTGKRTARNPSPSNIKEQHDFINPYQHSEEESL